jgi:predicted helicase
MLDLLRSFPAIWASLGLLLGAGVTGVAMFVVMRKFGPMKAEALKELVDAYKLQIESNQSTLQMQKQHYELENAEITKERNTYRENLHEERKQHNAASLRIKELEMRPDITALFRTSEAFYTKQTEAMTQLILSLRAHDEGVGERMKPIYESLGTMGKGIEELLRRTDAVG